MDIARCISLECDLSILEFLVEDSPEGSTLLEASLSAMVGTIFESFTHCF